MVTVKTRPGDRLIVWSGRKNDRQIVHTQILGKGSVEVVKVESEET